MKLCKCKEQHAIYCDLGLYKCQYCSGLLVDLNRVEKIIDFNTPINIKDRNNIIRNDLQLHKWILDKQLSNNQ